MTIFLWIVGVIVALGVVAAVGIFAWVLAHIDIG